MLVGLMERTLYNNLPHGSINIHKLSFKLTSGQYPCKHHGSCDKGKYDYIGMGDS